MKEIDKNTTIRIIGKGPTIEKRIKRKGDEIIVALNSAIIICDDVDFLFMNDRNNIQKIPRKQFQRPANIVIPTYPHLEKEIPSGLFSYARFVSEMGFRHQINKTKIYIHQLDSSPFFVEGLPRLGKSMSVAETAIAWFIYHGFRNFETEGITLTYGYSKFFSKETLSKNHSLEWLKENTDSILKRIDEAGAKIKIL